MTSAAASLPCELGTSAATSLLVSVRDAREAAAALAGGADWIDLKEPHRGALGAVEVSIACEVVRQVADRAPVTAAAGELLAWRNSAARDLLQVEGVQMVKLGLAGCAERRDWQTLWQAAAEEIACAGKSLVMVVYADRFAAPAVGASERSHPELANQPPAAELIALALRESSVKYLLVDTCDKQSGSLLEQWNGEERREFFQLAKTAGLQTVAAGGLAAGQLAELPLESIDVVGVRGAVCPQARTGEVDEDLVRRLRTTLQELTG